MGEGRRTEQPRVLLLRTPRPDDPYEAALRRAGFEVRSLPVLRFEYIGQELLRAALAAEERYAGLVVTSPRAVRALERVGVPAAWTRKRAFAVGPRTAEALAGLGLVVDGEEAGSAARLAPFIIAQEVPGCLLVLSGDRRREELPAALTAAGVCLEELTVYRTLPEPTAAVDTGGTFPEAAIVFFSPSGVEAFIDAGGDVRRRPAVAIGPTTAASLRAAEAAPLAVAPRPDPAGVVAAVRALSRYRSFR